MDKNGTSFPCWYIVMENLKLLCVDQFFTDAIHIIKLHLIYIV